MEQPHYIIHKTPTPITITGRIDDPAWENAPWSDRFVDIIIGEPVIFDTRVKCLWDDEKLYIAFRAEEPFVRAELTERDSIIFSESDMELFLGTDDAYYELEINARNTIYEVFYVWRDAYIKNNWHKRPEYDLLTTEARTFGGNYDRTDTHFWTGRHPRGDKFAFIHWDMPGLETAVHVDGTLNDDTDIDKGWSLEIAIPWTGLADLRGGRTTPPTPGDTWRMGFYRFEQLRNAGEKVILSWGLDPVYLNDCHQPERFSPILFADRRAVADTLRDA